MTITKTTRTIWSWFKDHTNIPDIGIAALMGNLYAESNLEPVRKQGDFTADRRHSISYAAKADAGDLSEFCAGRVGWGLAQWTFETRCEGLANLAKARGASVGDLETQLEYIWQELTNDFSGVLYTLRTASSIRIASDKVLQVYENPALQTEEVSKLRAGYAQSIYDALHGSGRQEDNEPTEAEKRKVISWLYKEYCHE